MKINEFKVETWMTDHENDCQYNLTETCVSSLTLSELQQFVSENISDHIMSMKMDYGPIVGSQRLKKPFYRYMKRVMKVISLLLMGPLMLMNWS